MIELSFQPLFQLRPVAGARVRQACADTGGCFCWPSRCYKRYFYCHLTTGETQWDYPDGAETEPDSAVMSVDVATGHVPAPNDLSGQGEKAAVEDMKEGREAAGSVSHCIRIVI